MDHFKTEYYKRNTNKRQRHNPAVEGDSSVEGDSPVVVVDTQIVVAGILAAGVSEGDFDERQE